MHIRYSLTRADLLAGTRMRFGSLRLALTLSGGFFAAMAITEAWHTPVASLLTWIAFLALGSLAFGTVMTLALRFILLPIQVARLHSQNPTSYRDLELIADAEGLAINGLRSNARFPWSEIRGFKENDRLFLIIKSKTLFFTVPKRDLPAKSVIAFSNLMSERLQGRARP